MKITITESKLRKIVREVLKEDGFSTVAAAAATALGATPSGAQYIGQHPGEMIPSAGEAFKNTWNSDIFKMTLSAVNAIAASACPGTFGGTCVVQVATAQLMLAQALSRQDWVGCAFALICTLPVMGPLSQLSKLGFGGLPADVKLAIWEGIKNVTKDNLKTYAKKLTVEIAEEQMVQIGKSWDNFKLSFEASLKYERLI